jgi:hypothetical protein
MPERDAAAGLVDGYLKLGHLQLRFDEEADGKVILRGDLGFADQCARSAAALARRNRLASFEPLVERLRTSLEETRSVQAARPGQVVVRPRTRPILTRPSGSR